MILDILKRIIFTPLPIKEIKQVRWIFTIPVFFTLNPDILQIAERSAVTFHVVDSHDGDSARGDYVKRMLGVVRPLLKWTTQFNSNRANPADMATKNAKL